MKRFNTLADMLSVPRDPPLQLRKVEHERQDAKLARIVCTAIIEATHRPTWRGIRCLLRPAV